MMSLSATIRKELPQFRLDVSLTSQNDVTGVLGASGDGKSMTLKCLAGIETPDSGKICVNGRVLFDSEKGINLPPQKRRVGYLFQHYALFPHFSVAKNILCGMTGSGKEKQDRLYELARLFRLEHLLAMYPANLSGGQQQRVALARLLASKPDILLLDEPFSALDAHLKEYLEVELAQILEAFPNDVILVTHNRDEAYHLCNKLAILDNGRIIEHGRTQDLFNHPRCLTSAKLTGCKNFSPVTRLSRRTLAADDWGLTFTLDRDIPEDIAFVGIRAHSFFPASDNSGVNSFPVTLQKQIEGPFEWRCVVTSGGSQPFWWKQAKEGKNELPNTGYLSVAANDILLLKKN